MLFVQILTATPSETKRVVSFPKGAWSFPSDQDQASVLLAQSMYMPLAKQIYPFRNAQSFDRILLQAKRCPLGLERLVSRRRHPLFQS